MATELRDESLQVKIKQIEIGDRKTAWEFWRECMNYGTLISTLRCLLLRAPLGRGLGPHGRSLMMEALSFSGNCALPHYLMDLHEEDLNLFPMDLELVENNTSVDTNHCETCYTSVFSLAVREAPLFALRLAPLMNDSTLLQRPFPGWPLLGCIIDDIFRGHPQFTDEYIKLACHLLQPSYDFRFPIHGPCSGNQSSRNQRSGQEFALETQPLEMISRPPGLYRETLTERVRPVKIALKTAIQRLTHYRLHFANEISNILKDSLPGVLIPLIVQFASPPLTDE